MKIIDESGGRFEVVLYSDGNLISRRVSDKRLVGAMGVVPLEPDPEPDPEPELPPVTLEHPNPIRGQLRAVDVTLDSAHFVCNAGEILPVGLTWFGALEQRRSDPEAFKRTLSAVAGAGYQYARVLFAVAGGHGYWDGHEVAPHDCMTTDGVRVKGWSDYEEQCVGLGQDFAAHGLQVFVSSGGLDSVFAGDLDHAARWSWRVGELLRSSGVRVSFVDVNEAWQNWITGSEPTPDDVDTYVIQPFLAGYGKLTIALRSAPYSGETCEGFNLWAGDVIQKHGHRGHFPQDHTTAVRHARGIYYDERGGVEIPAKRVGIESEPVGPGASVNTLDGEEALALLAVANMMGGFAYVYHSSCGVRWWDGPIQQQPGFLSSPRVVNYLPTDLMSRYTTILHGGLSDSPLTDADGFPDENRVDSVVTADGRRFVTLAYGQNGYTRLLARVAVRFSIITPDTGDSHRFTLRPGETLDIDYKAGRVLVGEVL